MSSTFRRSSYASVAAGIAPSSYEHTSPPRTTSLPQQRDDPSSRDSTPQQPSRSQTQAVEMEAMESERSQGDVSKQKMLSGVEASTYFTPSYLRRSRHMERLDSHYRQRQQATKEARNHHTAPGLGSRQPSSSNLSVHKIAAGTSHRGVNHDVIERLPPSQSYEGPNPIPTRWNDSDKCFGLELIGNGTEVKYQGTARTPDDAAAVRSDHHIPQECGMYYYEVTVLSRGKEGLIGIGFSGLKPSLNRLPGWENDSWGYHGDDGCSFASTATGKAYGPKFSALDVIGCGINFRTGSAFFTKNGIFLGDAFQGIKTDRIYPCVGIKKPGEHLRANFGQTPFVFDIDSVVERERRIVQSEISKTDLDETPLISGLSETDTINELVSQYLAHEGFTDTGSQFVRDVREQKQVLSADGRAPQSPLEADDTNATHRQNIRAAILRGDIDRAFKYLGAYFPMVLELESNRDTYFRLRCRKFIEMILRSYEAQAMGLVASEGRSEDGMSQVANGHGGGGAAGEAIVPLEPKTEGMDLDGQAADNGLGRNDLGDSMETSTDSLKGTPAFAETKSAAMMHNELLTAAIQYGMELQGEFINDTRKEVKEALNDTFALLAYTDARESLLAELMEGKGRIEIAEQVNGAILVSLGKPRSALLEQLCAQTSVLVDMVSREGGPATFVNLQRDYLQ